MKWLVKTKAGRVTLIGIVTVAILAFIGWQLFLPKYGHATVAEIEAALTPDLGLEPKVDESAVARMDRVIDIARKLDDVETYQIQRRGKGLAVTQSGPNNPEREILLRPTTLPAQRLRLAKKFWADNRKQLDQLSGILAQGDLQVRPTAVWEADHGYQLFERDLVRVLGIVGETLGRSGDFTNAQQVLDIANRLAMKLLAAGGDSVNYLGSLAIMSLINDPIRNVARLPSCPVELCRHWLEEIPPTPIVDQAAIGAMKQDFREFVLPQLADPESLAKTLDPAPNSLGRIHGVHFDEIGRFDPIATARISEQMLSLDVKNASRPFNAQDTASAAVEAAQSRGLPAEFDAPNGIAGTWKRTKFVFLMNLTENSIGRMALGGLAGFRKSEILGNSCAWRARREATRVVLATAIYRREHQGNLPPTLTDLVSKYLVGLPVDPFTGEPMHYDAAKQRVWSEGEGMASPDEMIIYAFWPSRGYSADLSVLHN